MAKMLNKNDPTLKETNPSMHFHFDQRLRMEHVVAACVVCSNFLLLQRKNGPTIGNGNISLK